MANENEVFPEQLVQLIALLTGRLGGQTLYGGTLTAETLDLLNNIVDQLGIHIAGDGKVTIDRDTTIGQAGVAGVVEVKDASDVVRAKLNPVDASILFGLNNTGNYTALPREIESAADSLIITDLFLNATYADTAPVVFTIPIVQTWDGRIINVRDNTGNASTNSITLETENSDTIQHAANLVIVNDNDSATLQYDLAQTNWGLI